MSGKGRLLPLVMMKLSCSVYWWMWFLLLFGAGSMLLLLHLPDFLILVHTQNPTGTNSMVTPSGFVEKDFDTSHPAEGDASQPQGNTTRRSPLPLTPASHDDQEDDFSQRMAQTQASRQERLKEMCAKYQPSVANQVPSRVHVGRVYTEDRSKLLYCEVPKVGCSNWKRVFMVLGGSATDIGEIAHEAAHKSIKKHRLDRFNSTGIAKRLRAYTKFLFVREPFERVVSAFRDKFENPNSYYHPVFGRPIIRKYRANASRDALLTGAGVTFREFVQYLVDAHRPVGMDIHWEPSNKLCHPCLLHYDFIGKFENMEEEANFLLQKIGAPVNLKFPHFKDRDPLAERTSSRITDSYMAQLNTTERQKLYDLYSMDYLMFNYLKPIKDLN